MSSTGDPDYEDNREIDVAPRRRQELAQWLVKPVPNKNPFYEDTWRDVCRTRFFHSFFALCDLAKDDTWPADRWREALQVWAEKDMVSRTWRYAAPLIQTLPDSVFLEISNAVAWWIHDASKSINQHEDILQNLCRRVLDLPLNTDSGCRSIRNGVETYDPVGSAINHSIGLVTRALINLWFKKNPNDNDSLPEDLRQIFTELCDARVDRFRHARVLLGAHLIAFYRVDRPWTEQYLLPLFDWSNPVEARAVWEGFLWSPRLYQPLLTAFKVDFLNSANHYADLGVHRQQFARFLTYTALGPTDGYSVDEFRAAFRTLPQEGLEEAAQALSQALEGAGDQREEYWQNRVQPFWQYIWPKSRNLATPRIAGSLTRLAIAARGEFPAALATVWDWLQSIEFPDYIVHLLHESDLCRKYPIAALDLLDTVISGQQWVPMDLDRCLEEIAQAESRLAQDARYQRLQEYVRKHG